MPKPWIEELDDYLLSLSQRNKELRELWWKASGVRKPKIGFRMEHLRESLELIVKAYEGKKLSYGDEIRAVPELKLAFRQFTQFDYQLIAFTYGPHHKIARRLKLDRAIINELNTYLTKNSSPAVEAYFELLTSDSFSLLPHDEENHEEFSSQVDELWAHALVIGKVS